MANAPKTNKAKTVKVVPSSKSIEMAALKQFDSGAYPDSEMCEIVSPKKNQTENQNILNRSASSSVYQIPVAFPLKEPESPSPISNYAKIINLSRLNRFLILIKMFFSVIYIIASPISLVIYPQDLLGYAGVRCVNQAVTLVYIMLLLTSITIRITVSIMLGVNFSSLPAFLDVMTIITIIFAFFDAFQIFTLVKFYNTLSRLDPNIKKDILSVVSTSCFPP